MKFKWASILLFACCIQVVPNLFCGADASDKLDLCEAKLADDCKPLVAAQPALSEESKTKTVSVARPRTVTREEWGSKPAPIPDTRKQVPVWITIHHAGEFWKYGKDPVEFVRNMQIWGQNRPKLEKPPRDTFWPDLPYHFMIAPDGRIFEGRPVEYEPETNTKYSVNGNIGVEMMGDFEKQRPSIEQIRSCVAITSWLSQQHNINLDHVRTHMDAAPNQTDCPGKDFYRYVKDGQFKKWIAETLAGQVPKIEEGPPLPDGPSKSINDPNVPPPN